MITKTNRSTRTTTKIGIRALFLNIKQNGKCVALLRKRMKFGFRGKHSVGLCCYHHPSANKFRVKSHAIGTCLTESGPEGSSSQQLLRCDVDRLTLFISSSNLRAFLFELLPAFGKDLQRNSGA